MNAIQGTLFATSKPAPAKPVIKQPPVLIPENIPDGKPVIIEVDCPYKLDLDDYGYTNWNSVREAMARQAKAPFLERLRPCPYQKSERQNYWWIERKGCMAFCDKAIWKLAMYGQEFLAGVQSIERHRIISLCVKGTGELLTYIMGKGFVDGNQ